MPGENLTRAEARIRAGLLEVTSYDVALDLTDGAGAPGEGSFRSTSTIHVTVREPGDTHLDLVAVGVPEVELDGEPRDAAFDGGRVGLIGLTAGEHVLRVSADCAYSRTGEGLHRFVDPVDDAVYLYSQFETFDAHRMYACFDQPDLKATFGLTVTAPADWEVVANAAADGEPEKTAAGARVHRFATTPPISTYITALVAGPYHVARSEHDGIPLGLYCRASLAEHLDADELFDVTRRGFDFYHRVFDYPYPFGKYDQLFVPEFNAGAMENAGAVTILEDYVFRSRTTDVAYERRAETILHELAHMWFGDLVTMRWWDDLWLNESFATYMSVLCQSEATRWTDAWTTFANVEKSWAYRQDQLPTTHPIGADMVDIDAVRLNFDGITYAKGASVLKQLVAWVGREEFLTGVRRYFRRFAFANTTLADLLGELEQASGRDLSAWSRVWLETAGVATLRPRFEVGPDGSYTALAIDQEVPPEHPTLRPHRLAVGLYDRSPQGLVRRDRVELDIDGESTDVPALVGVAQPDLLLLNDDDLAYAKIRLDERSTATLTEAIGEFTESLPRALCWSAAWDMTRDGELPATDYLRLVLAGLEQETDIGVVQSLLRLATQAVLFYVAPDHRQPARVALVGALADLIDRAEAGSDRQLAFVRAYAGVAVEPADLERVAGLLSGSAVLPGLAVDAELRWALLRALVAHGVAGEAAITAELERDPTAAGQRQAAAAEAARPDAEAKEQAWRAVVEDAALPNATQAAVIAGFQQVDQRDLLTPYVERYLDAIERVWREQAGEMAHNIANGLFPSVLAEPGTLARVDDWLAAHEPAPGLRRVLLEARDGLERALRAQDRDTAAATRG